ncbi:Transcription initiation factor TFIID subunit 12 [Dispira parvispora]|uniref:TBP-associated factor 12 n=1 Tax=Dispira parvispora TaxID=1520584 RepID=A0A9W8E459_9FUNG|nr:Transcription initiation factor TFIID subunit 12 [Dispira parvispora]
MTSFTGPYAEQLDKLQTFLFEQRQQSNLLQQALAGKDPADLAASQATIAASLGILSPAELKNHSVIVEANSCADALRASIIKAIQASRQPSITPEEHEKYQRENSEANKDLQLFRAMLASAESTAEGLAAQLKGNPAPMKLPVAKPVDASSKANVVPAKTVKPKPTAPGEVGDVQSSVAGPSKAGESKIVNGNGVTTLSSTPKPKPNKPKAHPDKKVGISPSMEAIPIPSSTPTVTTTDTMGKIWSPESTGMSKTATAPSTTATTSSASLLTTGAKASALTPLKGNETLLSLSGPLASSTHSASRASSSMDVHQSTRMLSKRKIQELVAQIDPAERLEPEVEDMLCEIADEFIESVASFACQLAKHRKSRVLEAKDVQLHLERNWNIRIPGFAAERIRSLRKPIVHPTHQQRMQSIGLMRSMKRFDKAATSSAAPSGTGNSSGHPTAAP